MNRAIASQHEIIKNVWLGNAAAAKHDLAPNGVCWAAIFNITEHEHNAVIHNAVIHNAVIHNAVIHNAVSCNAVSPLRVRYAVGDPGPASCATQRNYALQNKKMLQILRTHIVDFILHMRKFGPVLVHCHAGVQRSATVVAAVLMRSMSLHAAVHMIVCARPQAFAYGRSVNFAPALRHLISLP